MTNTPPIQYARSADGTSIAYADYDPELGRPLLVVPGFGFTMGLWTEAPIPAIDTFRVGTFDRRGTGRSDRNAPIAMELFVEDCLAVADALGFEAFHLYAWYQAAFEAVQLTLRFPERIRGLILQNPAPPDWGESRRVKAWRSALENDWDWFAEAFVAGRGEPDPEQPELARLVAEFKNGNEPEPFRRVVQTLAQPANMPSLDAVSVPTIVVLREDYWYPALAGKDYASRIPSARLVIDRVATTSWKVSPETDDAIRRFLIQTLPPEEVPLSWRSNETFGTEERPSVIGLSARELEVLRLVAVGCSNREIAAELTLSLPTVATHLRHILDKLGVPGRAAAAAWAVRKGLA